MSRARFETPSDGLADVFQGLRLRASLGDAAGNGRALSNEHAGLVGFQRHEQLHTWILLHVATDDRSQSSGARRSTVIIGAEEVYGCQTQTTYDRPVYRCRSSRVPRSAHVPRNTHPGRRCVGAGRCGYGLGKASPWLGENRYPKSYCGGRSARHQALQDHAGQYVFENTRSSRCNRGRPRSSKLDL